jgi:lactate permease
LDAPEFLPPRETGFVASTATQTYGQEGSILRFVFLHSLALAALAGICVSLPAYVPLLASLVAH